MGFLRYTIALAFVGVLVFYLAMAGELAEQEQYAAIGVMLVLGFTFIFSGQPTFDLPEARQVRSKQPAVASETVASEPQAEDSQTVTEVPLPDKMTLKERKAAKIRAAQEAQRAAMAVTSEKDEVELPFVTVETVHVADEYVVEVSPESVEEADIQATVAERASRHDEIRQRIEARRRSQMADIRASSARMWEEHAVREDLVEILQKEGHGLAVLDEPAQPEAGHIYGATFIRIDDQRVLKYRSPLDSGFEAVITTEKVLEKDPTELPPLMGPDGNPLPLPLPGPSGALAALKEEMNE
jgi:microcystin-dependent protein